MSSFGDAAESLAANPSPCSQTPEGTARVPV